jgi:hypothetical protein
MNASDLDKMHCSTPGCDCDDGILWLTPSCHPEATVEAYYVKKVQRIYISCAACKKFVCSVNVK